MDHFGGPLNETKPTATNIAPLTSTDDHLYPELPQSSPNAADHDHDDHPIVGSVVLLESSSKSKSHQPSGPTAVRYRECLKNHAASMGGNIMDGCGEFMPSGEEGTLEAFNCAACGCHRNFHRKDKAEGGNQYSSAANSMRSLVLPSNLNASSSIPFSLPMKSYGPNKYSSPAGFHYNVHPLPVNVGFGGGTESSSEVPNYDHHVLKYNGNNNNEDDVADMGPTPRPPFVLSTKKRVRTKFTQKQKERMLEYAGKVGWRIVKENEEEVERFCGEIGVRRHVFKVWMHNNKSSSNNISNNVVPNIHNMNASGKLVEHETSAREMQALEMASSARGGIKHEYTDHVDPSI